jgi:hypothetical protein
MGCRGITYFNTHKTSINRNKKYKKRGDITKTLKGKRKAENKR